MWKNKHSRSNIIWKYNHFELLYCCSFFLKKYFFYRKNNFSIKDQYTNSVFNVLNQPTSTQPYLYDFCRGRTWTLSMPYASFIGTYTKMLSQKTARASQTVSSLVSTKNYKKSLGASLWNN